MQADQETLKEAGINIVAISYDPVETLAKYAEANNITFPLLSDEGSKTIEAYGIRNTDMDKIQKLAGIPHPGSYVLDKDGIIQGKLFKQKYGERHTTEELLELVKTSVKE